MALIFHNGQVVNKYEIIESRRIEEAKQRIEDLSQRIRENHFHHKAMIEARQYLSVEKRIKKVRLRVEDLVEIAKRKHIRHLVTLEKRAEKMLEKHPEFSYIPVEMSGSFHYDEGVRGTSNYDTELIREYIGIGESEPNSNAIRYPDPFLSWWQEEELRRTKNYTLTITN